MITINLTLRGLSMFQNTIKICGVVLLLIPYVVGFSPNPADSSTTTVEFAIGKGSYSRVSRDCSGNIIDITNVPFKDAGVSIDHYFSVARVGIKGGILLDDGYRDTHSSYSELVPPSTTKYMNPNAGLNTGFFGLDIGAVLFDDQNNRLEGDRFIVESRSVYPTGKIRLGYLDSWYFTTSLLSNVPIVTGGGLFDIGLGFNLGKPHSNLWVGMGVAPYDLPIFSLRGDFPMYEKFLLSLRGGLHTGDGYTEYGVALGSKIIF